MRRDDERERRRRAYCSTVRPADEYTATNQVEMTEFPPPFPEQVSGLQSHLVLSWDDTLLAPSGEEESASEGGRTREEGDYTMELGGGGGGGGGTFTLLEDFVPIRVSP